MQLLITTYRQDIRTNFSCVCDRSTLFTHFSGQLFKIFTNVLVTILSFRSKDQLYYNIIQKQY